MFFLLLFFQLVCPLLSSQRNQRQFKILHHQHQSLSVCWTVLCWTWVMRVSPGTKETVYSPASVSLISTTASICTWSVWIIPTAALWLIHSPTKLHTSTTRNTVRDVQVSQDLITSSCVQWNKNSISSSCFIFRGCSSFTQNTADCCCCIAGIGVCCITGLSPKKV